MSIDETDNVVVYWPDTFFFPSVLLLFFSLSPPDYYNHGACVCVFAFFKFLSLLPVRPRYHGRQPRTATGRRGVCRMGLLAAGRVAPGLSNREDIGGDQITG